MFNGFGETDAARPTIQEPCENKNDVGLSVGWADYYRPEAEDQYIEIDKIQTGIYSIRFKINKTDLVQELGEPVSIKIKIDKEKNEVKPII